MKRWLLALCLCLTIGISVADTPPPLADGEQILVMLQRPPAHYRPDGSYGGGYADGVGRSQRRGIAEALAHEYGLTLVADWPMPLLGVDCYVMQLPRGVAAEAMAQRLSRLPQVQWSQPLNRFRAQEYNDPLYPLQPAGRLWHLDELHHLATGRDVSLAVIDSGVDRQHPDLAGQIAHWQNFVDSQPFVAEAHGTAVAAIIAARAGNGVGIAGVAPQARLLALRACWQDGDATRCNSLTLARALQYAIGQKPQIINLSLSGPSDRLLARLLDVALARGIVLLAAVDPQVSDGGFPASHPGVIAVSDQPDVAAANHSLLAPGRDIPTAVAGGGWRLVNGSSYATAHVAGLYALLAELRPAALAHAPASVLAQLPGSSGAESGNIDACATLGRLAGACSCSCTLARNAKSLPQ